MALTLGHLPRLSVQEDRTTRTVDIGHALSGPVEVMNSMSYSMRRSGGTNYLVFGAALGERP